MTPKNERFCQEYMIDLNGKQAAIRAGYSPKCAEVQASRLLSNANIASRITELKKKLQEKTQITQEYVLNNLKEVGERCLQKKPVMKWDYANKQMTQVEDEQGNSVWAFDSQGANRAFELLGKHIGIFEADNSQRKAVFNVTIDD